MSFVFGAPHRYHQGPNKLDEMGAIIAPLGPRPLIVVDEYVLNVLGDRIQASCAAADLSPEIRAFSGEITYAATEYLRQGLSAHTVNAAVGIGGGKALDAAKAVALALRLPVVTVPTIASNDSPTSAAIAMYDDEHNMICVDRLHRSPEAVIVDSALIAAAPTRYLLAGIGDALSKKFEADGCLAGTGHTPFGTRPGLTGSAIADACYRTLRQHAPAGLAAAARHEVTPELEAVIEATLLMSGLGFENGGLSLAHSLTRGLVKNKSTRNAPHGLQIAWALIVQLAAAGHEDAYVMDVVEFLADIGLPIALHDLGMAEASLDDIASLAEWTMSAPHLANMPKPLTKAAIVAAINRAEALSARHHGGNFISRGLRNNPQK